MEEFVVTEDMKWRIWDIDETNNKLILISDKPGNEITLKCANGYNNGVYILNHACSTTYGAKTRYGEGVVKARSINQEDIEEVTNMTTIEARQAAYPTYLKKSQSASSYNGPTIFEQEARTPAEIEQNDAERKAGTIPTTKIGRSYQDTLQSCDITYTGKKRRSLSDMIHGCPMISRSMQ